MASAAKANDKELKQEALAFVEKASPDQLVNMAKGTALGLNPLVKNFSPEKAEELRTLMKREFKDHADFRGMIIRQVVKLVPRKAPKEEKASESAPKEEKKEKPAKEGKKKKEG